MKRAPTKTDLTAEMVDDPNSLRYTPVDYDPFAGYLLERRPAVPQDNRDQVILAPGQAPTGYAGQRKLGPNAAGIYNRPAQPSLGGDEVLPSSEGYNEPPYMQHVDPESGYFNNPNIARRISDVRLVPVDYDPFEKKIETYGGLLPHMVRESDLYMANPRAPYEYIEPPAAGELPPHLRYPDEVQGLYRNVPRGDIPENKDLIYREGAPPPIIPLPNNTLSNPTYNWQQDNPHSGKVISGLENPVIEEGPTPKAYQPGFGLINKQYTPVDYDPFATSALER